MSRKKLKRFAEIEAFPNVICWPENLVSGWSDRYFGNRNPVTLEIACGKGEYTVGLARRHPQRNFVGIDRKGERIWRGARTALDENLKNVLFVQSDAGRLIELFDENSISEIWIAFPDPFPKESRSSRRLTAPQYLQVYRRLLKPGGQVRLKTDDDAFFAFTLETLNSEKCLIHDITFDLYDDTIDDHILSLKTTYERRHLEAGRTIKYVRFAFVRTS